MWVTPNDPSVDKFDARVHGSRTSGFGNFSSIQLDRRRRIANKATCLGVRNFCKRRDNPNLLGERECLAYKYRIRLLQMFVFAATTRTASLMLTTLPTTTRTGTGAGARLLRAGARDPTLTQITRTLFSPRQCSLGRTMQSVSASLFYVAPLIIFILT